ncbi:FIST N-terminal domain-containing protein [Allisonella histaminiformans]|uniref:FIST N-terminal domain-containing protein n=1 Tax=Allisonella histaminiformans TaxID=209880 RepID=UPI00350E4BCE
MQQHLLALCNTFPGVRLTGCTSITNLEADTPIPEETVLTLMTFEESDFYIYRFSQKSVSVREAARDFTKKLSLLQNVRGIMYLYSGAEHKPEEFISYLPKVYNQIPVFGMQAVPDSYGALCHGQIFPRPGSRFHEVCSG